jgi:hypothetical protein
MKTMNSQSIPTIKKIKLDGLSNASRYMFNTGFRINRQNLDDMGDIFCVMCKEFFENEDTVELELNGRTFYTCKGCATKFPNIELNEEELSIKAYEEFKEFRKKNKIQLDNRKCPSCGDPVFYSFEKEYGATCVNPKCNDMNFCYYFNKCGNHMTFDDGYGDTWGDEKSGEPEDMRLCKQCYHSCKCKISDKGKITKRHPDCFRHVIKHTDKITERSGNQ